MRTRITHTHTYISPHHMHRTWNTRTMSVFLHISLILLFSIPCYSFQPRTATTTLRKIHSSSRLEGSTDPQPQPQQSQQPAVLCIGDALFDCIANEDARGLSVEEMVERHSWTAFPGGAPANVASACCKLGTTSAFIGCLGSDEDGEELTSLLQNIGVDVSLVQRLTPTDTVQYPTRRVMVTRSLEGDREFGGFYGGRAASAFSDCQLDATHLVSADNHKDLQHMMEGSKWIVCSTLSLAFDQSANAVQQFVKEGLAADTRLCVDVNWRPVFWPEGSESRAREEILRLARQAHIVKLTDEEAEWLLGIPAEEALSNPKRIHDESFPDARGVLVTAGEKGASYSLLGYTGQVEPFHVQVLETTGAGDAFTAGLLHGLLSLGFDMDSFQDEVSLEDQPVIIDQLVRFAAAAGALTCTNEGAIAAQPTFAQVESFLIHGEVVWS